MRNVVLRLVLLALAAPVASCSSPSCVAPMSEVSFDCPTTFDGTEAGLPACTAIERARWVRTCGGLVELSLFFNSGSTICHYDQTSHALVGARSDNDVIRDGCFSKVAGRQPTSACAEKQQDLMVSCP